MNDFFQHLTREFQLPLQNPVLIFSLILLIILLSPILLKRLNIPGIIGLIISGVMVGPNGFNILANNSAVNLFSTIGLLYIMFIAGLELDLVEFKSNKNKSILFGFLTFIFPLSIGFPVVYYILGYDFNASFLTASMFATHTLVAYPIVSRFGISKNLAVAVTVGGTILTDTGVLIILAVIMKNAEGSLTMDFWYRLIISLAIFSAIMFLLVPRIAKWFFSKLESEKHAHYIFVLAVVFFASFLAEVAGVEKIIGAFVAGLALNKLVPHSSALMNRIEFIGNALFIPFFLISVGMIVDVSVLLSGNTALIVAGTLTVVSLFGKWIAAFITRLVFKFTKDQELLIFGLSSSHAAATLAVILVGHNAGILDDNILNGTIILILITCVVASFATEKAAKNMILSGESDNIILESGNINSSEHILLPVADVEQIDKNLDLAMLIKDKKSPNPISILNIVPNDLESEKNLIKAKMKLEEYVKQGSAAETNINVITTIDHNAMSGISRTAREILSDIIIIGWPKELGFIQKIMGEKMDILLANADKTIMIGNSAKTIVAHKRIILFVPPFAELEKGFSIWLNKVAKLATELSAQTIIYANDKTIEAIQHFYSETQGVSNNTYLLFESWEDILVLARDIKDDDLIVFITARKGTLSYQYVLESVPNKIERYFQKNSKIIIYPKQQDSNGSNEDYEDLAAGPLAKGIETIGKGIETIFKGVSKSDR